MRFGLVNNPGWHGTMESQRRDNRSGAQAAMAAEFRWGRLAFWLPASLVHGAAVAWLATVAETVRAPLLLFSLLVGLVLGATLVGSMRVCQVGHRATILLGTLLAVSTVIATEHYLGYRDACDEARQDAATYQLAKKVLGEEVKGRIPVPPQGFGEFLRWRAARGIDFVGYRARGWTVWLIWGFDALLVLGAALLPVVPALGQPYCNRCGSWFRTSRKAAVDATVARGLADAVDVALPEEVESARYRLVTCNAGCGPTGFELRWEASDGRSSSASVWLDVGKRDQVVGALDRGTAG